MSPASAETKNPKDALIRAVDKNEADTLLALVARHPELKPALNEPLWSFDSTAINHARSRRMLDALLQAGADINARSQWWAGGFGLLDFAEPDLARYAIERGAKIDAHSAARLGMLHELSQIISADPELVHARGGDGQTPLHFAANVEIAAFLLEHGADINARDIDHESTPCQYMVRHRRDAARFLVKQGATSDMLLAAALGLGELVEQHLASDPSCIRMSVSEQYFPKRNPRSGGTIYIWTLGPQKTAHAVAREFGHIEILELLFNRSPKTVQLAVAAEMGDRKRFDALLASDPGLVQSLSEEESRRLVAVAQSNKMGIMPDMLARGWPANAAEPNGVTALHWAAFHGNSEMVKLLISRGARIDQVETGFNATPLGWAIHGSKFGWHPHSGDYDEAVELLLQAGAAKPDKLGGSEAVQRVLRRFGVN